MVTIAQSVTVINEGASASEKRGHGDVIIELVHPLILMEEPTITSVSSIYKIGIDIDALLKELESWKSKLSEK